MHSIGHFIILGFDEILNYEHLSQFLYLIIKITKANMQFFIVLKAL